MASRHLSRSSVLQALFACDIKEVFTPSEIQKALERGLVETGGDADALFARDLVRGILEKQQELDRILVKAAPQWPLEKIAPIDRNILRIGLFELLFGDRSAVPPKVALNEAIELAKSFGGDTSGKFVNGVLGAVYRDIGEPGKADRPKNPAPLPHEHLGGILLVSLSGAGLEVALVHDAFGRWTLPKAKCLDGEMTNEAAMRAMRDELGVESALKVPLGEHEYVAHEPGVGRIVRTVGYFLASVPAPIPLVCTKCEGVTEARWFPEESLSEIEMYPDLVPIIESGISIAKSA
ncbi:MAG: transcription antitermination factor NusB [Patescibacteria group bacterium]